MCSTLQDISLDTVQFQVSGLQSYVYGTWFMRQQCVLAHTCTYSSVCMACNVPSLLEVWPVTKVRPVNTNHWSVLLFQYPGVFVICKFVCSEQVEWAIESDTDWGEETSRSRAQSNALCCNTLHYYSQQICSLHMGQTDIAVLVYWVQ